MCRSAPAPPASDRPFLTSQAPRPSQGRPSQPMSVPLCRWDGRWTGCRAGITATVRSSATGQLHPESTPRPARFGGRGAINSHHQGPAARLKGGVAGERIMPGEQPHPRIGPLISPQTGTRAISGRSRLTQASRPAQLKPGTAGEHVPLGTAETAGWWWDLPPPDGCCDQLSTRADAAQLARLRVARRSLPAARRARPPSGWESWEGADSSTEGSCT